MYAKGSIDRVSGSLHLIWVVVLAVTLGGCASVVRLPEPLPTYAVPPAAAGSLAQLAEILPHSSDETASSSFVLVSNNADALKVRLAMIDLATRSLDLQYFIWEDDATGHLLLQHIIAAADRGVRVRLLLDDLVLAGQDDSLAALNQHPLIEVRVFNPWTVRAGALRPFQFLVEWGRLNHRMHNKLFIADGHFALLGGRNIGDRYFGVYPPFAQNDLDVLVSGGVLPEMISSFDRYWNASATVPIYWKGEADDDALDQLRDAYAADAETNRHRLASFAEPADGWAAYMRNLLRAASVGQAELHVDSPKVIRKKAGSRVYAAIKHLIARAQHDVLISTPYLVPDQSLVNEFARLTKRGVRVRIVTNSLASNSHVIAHTAYRHWRRPLLRAGVQLYEARARPKSLPQFVTPPCTAQKVALHSKAIVVDGRWTFMGSPNIDPRSLQLNTEVGVVIDDPTFARQVTAKLDRDMAPANAWRVTLDNAGWLYWHRGTQWLTRQPATGFFQRVEEFFLNLIPVKNQT